MLAVALLTAAAQAAPGDLDSSFATDGTVTTDFGTAAAARAVAPALGGKIVVAGGAGGDFALARYQPDGTPDTSLDADGEQTTDFGGQDVANGVVVQANGKIVAVGVSDGDFALVRYKGGGKLDPSFGEVTTDVGGTDVAMDVVRLADGRFVVVGGSDQDFAVVRYSFKGDPDSTFGTQGTVVTDVGGNDRAEAAAVQSDGRVVVAGSSGSDFALARYNTNGSLDASFDGDGLVTTDFGGGQDAAFDLAIQPDGKIVVAGTTAQGGSSDFAVARYNPDGSLDVSSGSLDAGFGVDGRVTTDFGGAGAEGASGIALQQNAGIVAVGGALSDFALARYDSGGDLDPSFGTAGKLTTDFSGVDAAEALLLQADGRIVVVGTTSAGDDFALARYLGDPTFPLIGIPPGIP